jgi:hypothetical protein
MHGLRSVTPDTKSSVIRRLPALSSSCNRSGQGQRAGGAQPELRVIRRPWALTLSRNPSSVPEREWGRGGWGGLTLWWG